MPLNALFSPGDHMHEGSRVFGLAVGYLTPGGCVTRPGVNPAMPAGGFEQMSSGSTQCVCCRRQTDIA
eukprot:14755594-Heterocapsa_arctica.AAC.1